MAAIVLIGAQWGDEGKGKATDLLGGQINWVVRYQAATMPATPSYSRQVRPSPCTSSRPAS